MGTKPSEEGQSPQMPSDGTGSVEKRSPGAACRRGERWLCPSRGAAARCAAKIKRIRHLVRGKMSVFIGRRWNLEAILSSTQRRPLQKCRALRRARPSCTRLLRNPAGNHGKPTGTGAHPLPPLGTFPPRPRVISGDKGGPWYTQGSPRRMGTGTRPQDGSKCHRLAGSSGQGTGQGDRAGDPPPSLFCPPPSIPSSILKSPRAKGMQTRGTFIVTSGRTARGARQTSSLHRAHGAGVFGAVLLGFGFRHAGTPLSPRPARRLLSQKGPRSSCTRPPRCCRGTSTNLRRPPTTP